MLKKFLVGTVVALALLVGSYASAADFGATTLKVGSRGEAVKALQVLVGATPADGIFGNMTKAKVMVWQKANGLTADGLFGAKSKVKANLGGAVSGNFPAGCTSASGFSTTTGVACVAIPSTTVAGCTAGALFSTTTGASCTAVVTTLPAGCTSTLGFSSTTGVSCSTGTTTTGALVGGAGSISLNQTNTNVLNTVIEGKSAQKVLGFKLTASDSDVALTNVKVTLMRNSHNTSASTRLDRYIDTVSIYMGSTKVGSASAADFTKDTTSYSKSIALTDAVVRMGESKKATFYVVVDAKSGINSSDTGAELDVTLGSVRFQDATGVIMTENGDDSAGKIITSNFGFETTTANDEVTLISSSINPSASNLKVNDDKTSAEHLAFAFKLKADVNSSDINVVSIPVSFTGSPVVNGDKVINSIYMKVGSKVYDNYVVSTDGKIYTFNFSNADFVIKAGDTSEVKLFVKFNGESSTTYDIGQTVKFAVGTGMVIENVAGDSVKAPTNTISSNTHTLQLEGVNFALGTVSVVNSSETTGIAPYVTVTIPLKVTTDSTLYINKTNLAAAIGLTVTSGVAASSISFVSGPDVPTTVTGASDSFYQIDSTGTLYIKAIITGAINGSVKTVNVQLNNVKAATTLDVTPTTYNLAPASSFNADATLRF